MHLPRIVPAIFWAGAIAVTPPVVATEVRFVTNEFIFTEAPFQQCHAPTLAETSGGELVAAWFGGAHEKSPDTAIWLSRRETGNWTAPREVANGIMPRGERLPVWNPVLFQPRAGPLLLFYKVGPDPSRWWGMWMASEDGGRRWTTAQRLTDGIVGPSKNKPVELSDATILSPSSSEGSGWKLFIERSTDHGQHWQSIGPLAGAVDYQAIQPALLVWSPRRVQLLARSRQNGIVQSVSMDGGQSWSQLTATDLANPNSGIDAQVLRDGRALLVYNPTRWRRTPLRVAMSSDGQHWRDALTLAEGWGEYSYPSIIQSVDGLVHVVYTWKRERIRHVVLDPGAVGGP